MTSSNEAFRQAAASQEAAKQEVFQLLANIADAAQREPDSPCRLVQVWAIGELDRIHRLSLMEQLYVWMNLRDALVARIAAYGCR